MSEEKKEPQSKRVRNPEIWAMAAIDSAIVENLEGLDDDAQIRVMAWVRQRHFAAVEESIRSLAREMERV